MGSRKISLADGTAPEAVLDVARAVLEEKGYKWIQVGATSAEAHEGGKEITKKRSRKLLLGLEVTASELVLQKKTDGTEGYVMGVPMGNNTLMRVKRRFRQARRSIEDALKSAGLA